MRRVVVLLVLLLLALGGGLFFILQGEAEGVTPTAETMRSAAWLSDDEMASKQGAAQDSQPEEFNSGAPTSDQKPDEGIGAVDVAEAIKPTPEEVLPELESANEIVIRFELNLTFDGKPLSLPKTKNAPLVTGRFLSIGWRA